jgi:hypothetical protein
VELWFSRPQRRGLSEWAGGGAHYPVDTYAEGKSLVPALSLFLKSLLTSSLE